MHSRNIKKEYDTIFHFTASLFQPHMTYIWTMLQKAMPPKAPTKTATHAPPLL